MLYWYGGMIKLLITGTSAVEIIPVPLAPAWHRITALVVTDKWRQTVCFGEVTFKLNLLTIVEHQCIGTQPFSTSSELLITSCSHKNLTTISQTVQELWDWQVNTQKHPPTKTKTFGEDENTTNIWKHYRTSLLISVMSTSRNCRAGFRHLASRHSYKPSTLNFSSTVYHNYIHADS